jgi:sodium/bile acid cotransporter 7
MPTFLARRWFLILLVVGITLTLVQPHTVQAVVAPIPTQGVVAITLFLMGWSLESRRLWQALARPLPALWAVTVTYGLTPCLGWVARELFAALGCLDYGLGILICTCVPCTLASAIIWTRLAGGNEATALLVTMLTTCTSWLITTAWLTLATGTQVEVDAVEMMLGLAVYLIVPVVLGQLARGPATLRWVAVRGKAAFGVISRLLILIVVLQAVLMVTERFRSNAISNQVPLLVVVGLVCIGTHLVGLAVSYWGGKLFAFDHPNRIAIAFAGSQKTLPVGLLLVNTYFRQFPLAVVPLLLYHVGQLAVDTFIADTFRNAECGVRRAE